MALRIRFGFAAKLAAAIALAGVMLLAWTQSQGAAQAEATRQANPAVFVRVVDGETIEDLRSSTLYRLANVDAARSGDRVACAAERRMGDRAAALTEALVARARRLDVLPTGKADAAGRPTAFVVADGRDLGEALVAQGFGRPIRDDGRAWCDAGGALIL